MKQTNKCGEQIRDTNFKSLGYCGDEVDSFGEHTTFSQCSKCREKDKKLK